MGRHAPRAAVLQAIELARSGLHVAEIARRVGMTHQGVRLALARFGVQAGAVPESPENRARAERIAAMYRQGLTLEKIGEHFGFSRERARQILAKQGFTRVDGGKSVHARARQDAVQAKREAVSLAKWGLPYEEMKAHRASGALRRFKQQQKNAAERGVIWSLTFRQWWSVWDASGKFALRGRGKGCYVMSRIKDSGGYELGNVHIQEAVENSREAVQQWLGKVKAYPRGIHFLYPGTPKPFVVKVQRVQIGRFASAEEGAAFREQYIRDNGIKFKNVAGSGRGWTYDARCKKPYAAQAAGRRIGYFATAEEAEAAYKTFCAGLQAQATQSGVESADEGVRAHRETHSPFFAQNAHP